MTEKTDHLVQRLTRNGQITYDFFSTLQPDDWTRKVYAEGIEWTVRTIFAHLVETEGSLLRLYQLVAQGHPGVSEDFDVNRWNAGKMDRMAELQPADLLPMYRERRDATIEWVKTLDDETLAREGRQASVGVQPLELLIKVFYIHNRDHIEDIQTALMGGAVE
jgi:hypothetical protein